MKDNTDENTTLSANHSKGSTVSRDLKLLRRDSMVATMWISNGHEPVKIESTSVVDVSESVMTVAPNQVNGQTPP